MTNLIFFLGRVLACSPLLRARFLQNPFKASERSVGLPPSSNHVELPLAHPSGRAGLRAVGIRPPSADRAARPRLPLRVAAAHGSHERFAQPHPTRRAGQPAGGGRHARTPIALRQRLPESSRQPGRTHRLDAPPEPGTACAAGRPEWRPGAQPRGREWAGGGERRQLQGGGARLLPENTRPPPLLRRFLRPMPPGRAGCSIGSGLG